MVLPGDVVVVAIHRRLRDRVWGKKRLDCEEYLIHDGEAVP